MTQPNKINKKTVDEYLATASPEQAKGFIDALKGFHSELNDLLHSPHPYGEELTFNHSKHVAYKKLTELHIEMQLITKLLDRQLLGQTATEPNNNLKIEG